MQLKSTMMKKILIKILRVILWRKCLQKNRKFVPEECDYKASESDSKDQTSDSSKSRIEGEKLDDDFQLESDILGKKGNSDGSNNGNVEKSVGNLYQKNQMKEKVMIPKMKKNQT